MRRRVLQLLLRLLVVAYVVAVAVAQPTPTVVPVFTLGYGYSVDLVASSPSNSTRIRNIMLSTGDTKLIVLQSSYDPSTSNTSTVVSDAPSQHVVVSDGADVSFSIQSSWRELLTFSSEPSFVPQDVPMLSSNHPQIFAAAGSRLFDLGFRSAEGLLGLSFDREADFDTDTPTSFLTLLSASSLSPPPEEYLFGLLLDPPALNVTADPLTPSTPLNGLPAGELHLGAVDPTHEAYLRWSELFPVPERTQYVFTLFHLSVCGADLFGNYTGHWPAIIRTSSACTTLPSEFFDHLVSWLPVKCDPATESSASCWLDPDLVDPATVELPWVSFQLSEDNPPVYLSLRDLVYEDVVDGELRHMLCLLRGGTFDYALSVLNPGATVIVLGSMALRSVYTAFHVSDARVAFANRGEWRRRTDSYVPGSLDQDGGPPTEFASCLALPQCRGGQVLYPARRTCIPPACSRYFFQELDEASQTCKYKQSIFVLLTLAIGFVLAAEVYLYRRRTVLDKKAMRPLSRRRDVNERVSTARTPNLRRRARRGRRS